MDYIADVEVDSGTQDSQHITKNIKTKSKLKIENDSKNRINNLCDQNINLVDDLELEAMPKVRRTK